MSNLRLLLENRDILRRAQQKLQKDTPEVPLKMWLLVPRSYERLSPLQRLQRGEKGIALFYAMTFWPTIPVIDPTRPLVTELYEMGAYPEDYE